jgi:hypothetical protein
VHYKILLLWSFGNDNWTLHQANSIYKYIPPPSYSSSSNHILQPHSNLQKLLTLSSTWVYFSAFQYTKLPHTRLAVLMLDTLVKGSSKQVYLHTPSRQGSVPVFFGFLLFHGSLFSLLRPPHHTKCASSSTTQGTQGPPQQVNITCIYPNIRCDEKLWFGVQSDMELNMFCMSTFLKIEYF